jgi:uncharacterized membrane protein YkvA (DUF1232 family)
MNKEKITFSGKTLKKWLHKYTNSLGQKFVYSVLLLVYAYKRSDTPSWAKNIIIGALGYVLAPIDSIPDLTPFLGFTDDLGVLTFGLVSIACYVNDEVRVKARKQLKAFFNEIDEDSLAGVDDVL